MADIKIDMSESKVFPSEKLGFDSVESFRVEIQRVGDYKKCGFVLRFADGYNCHGSFIADLANERTLQDVEKLMDLLKREILNTCLNRHYEIVNGVDTSKAYLTNEA
jgi:hypothetical protein